MNIPTCEDSSVGIKCLGCAVEDAGHQTRGGVETSTSGMQQRAPSKLERARVDLNLEAGPTGLSLVHSLAGLSVQSAIVPRETHRLREITWARAVVCRTCDEALPDQAPADVEANLQRRLAVEPTPEPCRETHRAKLLRPRLRSWHN